MGYKEVYDSWKQDPEGFWMQAAEGIDWEEKPSKALFDENAPLYEWFCDGKVNTCFNALDRHVAAGNGDRTAIIYDSSPSGEEIFRPRLLRWNGKCATAWKPMQLR